MISVTVNKKQIAEAKRLLADTPRAMPKIITRSVNKVAVKARTKIIRRVASEIAVKQKDLRQRNVKLKKANYSTQTATIKITGKRIPLIRFGAKQTKKGVTYKIKKSGGRKKITGAFVEAMSSGHRGAFRRKGKSRLPIVELFGPSIPAAMENVADMAKRTMEREIGKNLHNEINRQVGLVLERRKGAA